MTDNVVACDSCGLRGGGVDALSGMGTDRRLNP